MINIEQLYVIAYNWHISTPVRIISKYWCDYESYADLPEDIKHHEVKSFRFEGDYIKICI